jgi:U4/U6 small nuclear ribonucleoprotein PRP3
MRQSAGQPGNSNKSILLLFQGTEKQRRFTDFKLKTCTNEAAAREYLKTYGVEHYWDLSISESLLDGAED